MKTAPEGLSLGRLRGKCLFALTRQPLRRSGQPKAAAPDSWIRVASAPGEWSCIHGKPTGRNRAIVFSDAFRGLGAAPGFGTWRRDCHGLPSRGRVASAVPPALRDQAEAPGRIVVGRNTPHQG